MDLPPPLPLPQTDNLPTGLERNRGCLMDVEGVRDGDGTLGAQNTGCRIDGIRYYK